MMTHNNKEKKMEKMSIIVFTIFVMLLFLAAYGNKKKFEKKNEYRRKQMQNARFTHDQSTNKTL